LVYLSDSMDSVSWGLEPSGMFTTRSLYCKLIQGATVAHAKDIWKIACPLKVRILIWQLTKDRPPSNAQIKRRHSQSDGNCVLCHLEEDAAHIFFNCILAQFAWCCIRELLRVSWNSTSFAELFGFFQRFRGLLNVFFGRFSLL
jgi:hypothetical protein